MEVLAVLLALLVVFAAVVAGTSRKKQETEPEGARNTRSGREDGDLKRLRTFKVFTLARSGTGKTCFLASMFQRLCQLDARIGFSIRTSSEQRVELCHIFEEICDPAKEWPPGTKRAQVWRFSTYVPLADGSEEPVFNFEYVDYEGGIIQNGNRVLDADRRLQEADAILVMLDGKNVLTAMNGPGTALEVELGYLIPMLSLRGRGSTNGAPITRPLHFLISKYDIIEGRFSLADIRQRLMSHGGFSSLVERRRSMGLRTRLIPVSSVGSDFVTPTSEGGMQKKLRGVVRPQWVEIPMAACLIDSFETLVNAFEKADKDLIDAAVKEGSASAWSRVHAMLQAARHLPFPYSTPALVGDLFSLLWTNRSNSSEPGAPRIPFEEVRDKQAALLSAVDSHHRLMRRFERECPGTVLGMERANGTRDSSSYVNVN